jgi:hypothetical protein
MRTASKILVGKPDGIKFPCFFRESDESAELNTIAAACTHEYYRYLYTRTISEGTKRFVSEWYYYY